MAAPGDERPEGVFSLLDTDLYKLTMQSAVLKFFPDVEVTYDFTNRTPDMLLNRKAFNWLQTQIDRLGNIAVSPDEITYLRNTCTFLSPEYLQFLSTFRLQPARHIRCTFTPQSDTGSDSDTGTVTLHTTGVWVETILYEIPLLALTSEAYFKFIDTDWTHAGQIESAKAKGLALLRAGCLVSEFGSRRRRDYHTHELVLRGLLDAQAEGSAQGFPGKITGTSNVHFAMRFEIPPVGTVAHEWFMGVAAVTGSYTTATETALRYWVATFGRGVLGIALTDTFGTPHFLEAFAMRVPASEAGGAGGDGPGEAAERYADIFTGTRQDSGDPLEFVKTMRAFYDGAGIAARKTIVFSDSLNVDRCIEYREAAEAAGFQSSFGVGTFFTNDFKRASTGEKSTPLNIVIKLSSANGRPAVKISDNAGKNTGDSETVQMVKRRLGYTEHEWAKGDERVRWGGEARE